MSAILVIDDDSQVLQVLSEMLRLEGHEVTMAENGREGMTCFDKDEFDLVITDIIMPDREGLETIADLRQRSKSLPIIAISGGGRSGSMDYLETARYLGADTTLSKPFGRDELLRAVNAALEK